MNIGLITDNEIIKYIKKNNDELLKNIEINSYEGFIRQIIDDVAKGGILIIPLNFWSSIRKNDVELRKDFLEKYNVINMNIFEEQVFDDTTYTVCCFQFSKKIEQMLMNITIYPSKKNITANLNSNNNYTIGGNIYNLKVKNNYKISRITSKNINDNPESNTRIIAKCIDDNADSKIGLKYDKNIYIDDTPNQTARTYATLIITPPIDKKTQKLLVKNFNKNLNKRREKYSSLFLTNYRESKDIARKRISFDLIYNITEYILDTSS
jgi:hypothetical protein